MPVPKVSGPLEELRGGGGGVEVGGAKYQKNFRARENLILKNHARQLILKNIHALA